VKVSIVSDTHFGRNPYYDTKIAVDAFKHVVDEAAKSDSHALIIPGDFIDKPTIDGQTLNMVAECLSYAGDKGVELFILEGNHGLDRLGKSVIEHLRFYHQLAHITVIAYEPTVCGSFVFCPYGRTLDDAQKARAEARVKNAILVAHDDIQGAWYDNGVTCASRGFDPKHMRSQKWAAGVFGHIHRPQHIDGMDGSFFYSSGFLHFNFSAVGQDARGWVELDLETLAYKRKPLVGGRWPRFDLHTWEDWVKSPRDYTGDDLAFVDIWAKPDGPSDSEIQNALADAGAHEVFVTRPHQRVTRERRSTIAITDNHRVMAAKFVEEVFSDMREREEALQFLDRFLREMG